MTNNDILRRMRYLFDFKDQEMVALFELVEYNVAKTDVINWLKKPDDASFVEMSDKELAIFLNGLIIKRRGKREGPRPVPEEKLNNNIILQKLKIAFDLKSDDILDLYALIDKRISKHELSAFFRKPGHRSYRPCMDQFLRNFLNALQMEYKNRLG